jgi:Flp pilus assembly pilin Flp
MAALALIAPAVAALMTRAGPPDRSWRPWPPSTGGQGIVEYGLILSGIAVVAVVTLVFFGDQVAQVLDLIGNAIDSATGA